MWKRNSREAKGKQAENVSLRVADGAELHAVGTVGFVTRWLNIRVLSAQDLEVLMITLLAGISIGWGVLRGLFPLLAEPSNAETATAAATAATAATATTATEMEPASPALSRGAVLTLSLAAMAIVVLGLAPGPLAELAKAIASAYTFYP